MKNKKSTQNLFGLRTFGKYGLLTDKAGFAFFSVQPTNISVLSAENIDVKIHHLMMLLSMIPELEIICLDSCECFDGNKVHIKNRLKQEENPHIRKLLEQDMAFLDDIQVEMSFGSLYERVLPASSVANLYPLNYSGKTDEKGFYIGRDKFGTNILVDFDKRSDDKTNANVLILGNSGQGKSYLMKLLLTNLRESGKSVIVLDAEQEYADLTNNLGGTYLDFMSGEYMINPLEPKSFGEAEKDDTSPEPFRKVTTCTAFSAVRSDNYPMRTVGANLGHLLQSLKMAEIR